MKTIITRSEIKSLIIKIIKRIFYEQNFYSYSYLVCPVENTFANEKGFVSRHFDFFDTDDKCVHCDSYIWDNYNYHYKIVRISVLRPNFIGKILFFKNWKLQKLSEVMK